MTVIGAAPETFTERAATKPARFLFLASDYKPWPGGIATYIDNLVRGLRSLGDEARVLGVVRPEEKERIAFLEQYEEWASPFQIVDDVRPSSWLGDRMVSLLEIARCSGPGLRRAVETLPFFRNSCQSVAQFDRVLQEERSSTVVFGHLDLKLYAMALFLTERRRPYGILAHDVEVYRAPARKNDQVRRGMMLKGAGWIAANSHHTMSLLKRWGIPDSRIRIVHPPISEQAVQASSQTKRVFRHGRLNLVTVCRLVRPKGVDIVIRALAILKSKGIPFRYVVAGDGAERGFLEELARELRVEDRISFVGSISDNEKWHLLTESDVFVMTSRIDPQAQHEGFGIAFMEAAAFGVPGIGSDGGGIPDAILDGETGILVPQESYEALAETLCSLYRDPDRIDAMGSIARKRARSQFSPRAVAAVFKEQVSG